jgi:hypothetical protein
MYEYGTLAFNELHVLISVPHNRADDGGPLEA